MMTSRKDVPELGPLEFSLVRQLWTQGPSTTREVLDDYNGRHQKSLAYTTVMTLLTRLAEKEVLSVDRSRQPFRFSPLISRERLLRQRVKDFVDIFFEGQAVDLALRLVEGSQLSPDSVDRLEEVLRKSRADSPDDEDAAQERGAKK